MHTPWNPRAFLISEDELVDELCLAALMYRPNYDEGEDPVGYDIPLIRQVTAEVAWILFNLTHGGEQEPIPIKLN